MATLLTSTTISCDVISNNNLYHNSLNSPTYVNNSNNSTNKFTDKSNLEVYPKIRNLSVDTNEVNKKTKDSNNNFVSNKSKSTSSRSRCNSSTLKQIENSSNTKINKENNMTMSNSDVKENTSQYKTKKVENKKSSNINNKNINIITKNINNSNDNVETKKNGNSKIKTKTNVKITNTKVINLQSLNNQNSNSRLQTGNNSRKINIKNPRISTTKSSITKLKLPSKDIKDTSNVLSLSKLTINNKGCNNYANKYFTNYSYNTEFSKKYKVKEEMGRGGFGLVFVAERISDGLEVAVKFIIKEKVPVSAWVKDPELGIIPRECYLLKHVNHPCIIKYLDCYSDRKYFYLVTELHGSPWCKKNSVRNYHNENIDDSNKMHSSFINVAALKTNNKFQVGQIRPSMDLFECIESYFECFDEPQARHIFVQLLNAIKYLNSLSIIHRDIKDENILIDKDLNIKLIDFGAAIQINGGRVYDKFVGTIPYIAPEIINGKEYGSLTQDIYSLGVLLHLLIYGDLPAININNEDGSSTLHLPQYTIKGNYCSEKVRHLIRWMMQKSPTARPTLDEVLNHEWINEKTNQQ